MPGSRSEPMQSNITACSTGQSIIIGEVQGLLILRESGGYILISPTYRFSILCISTVSVIFKIIDKRQIPCD